MKTFSYYLIVAILLAGASAPAQQRTVRVKPGFATVIVCPAVPELVTVGNSQNFTVQNSGNYVLVKPNVTSGSTNLFIKAGMDSYNFVLQVADSPDLEIRLLPTAPNRPAPAAPDKESLNDGSKNGGASTKNGSASHKNGTATKENDLGEMSPKVRSIVKDYFKTPRRYTHSVKNSDVILALDHMVQIEDKLYLIGSVVNNSKIPYDIGYVRFRLIDHNRSLGLFRKKVKETEIEPVREFYNPAIKPGTAGRLLFVFDKQGFSDKSTVEIKCNEESGRRHLVLTVPGSYVQ